MTDKGGHRADRAAKKKTDKNTNTKREFDIVMSGQFCTLVMFSSGRSFLLHLFDFRIPLYHL